MGETLAVPMSSDDIDEAVYASIDQANRMHRRLLQMEDIYIGRRYLELDTATMLDDIVDYRFRLVGVVKGLLCLLLKQGEIMCSPHDLAEALMIRYSGKLNLNSERYKEYAVES